MDGKQRPGQKTKAQHQQDIIAMEEKVKKL